MTKRTMTPELQQRLQAKLSEFNIFAVIDKTGSMGDANRAAEPQGETRWKHMQEIGRDFIRQCCAVDDDGVDLIFFGGSTAPVVFNNVTADKVNEIFNGITIGGGTYLAPALITAFTMAKKAGKKALIPVFTDGEANDKDEVIKAIIAQANSQQTDDELTILFIQIGDDSSATKYLKSLDDDLQSQGAKFDIVDAHSIDEIGETPVLVALAEAIVD